MPTATPKVTKQLDKLRRKSLHLQRQLELDLQKEREQRELEERMQLEELGEGEPLSPQQLPQLSQDQHPTQSQTNDESSQQQQQQASSPSSTSNSQPEGPPLSDEELFNLLKQKSDSISLLSYDISESSQDELTVRTQREKVLSLLDSHKSTNQLTVSDMESFEKHLSKISRDASELEQTHQQQENTIQNNILQWKDLISHREKNIEMAHNALRRLGSMKQDFNDRVVSNPSYALKQYHDQLKNVVKDLTNKLEEISADKQRFENREHLWRKHCQQKDEFIVNALKREKYNTSKLRNRIAELKQQHEHQREQVAQFFEKAIMMNLNAHNCFEGYKLCMEEESNQKPEESKAKHATNDSPSNVGRVTPHEDWNDEAYLKLKQESETLQNETKLEKFLSQFPYNLRDMYVQPKPQNDVSKSTSDVRTWMQKQDRDELILTDHDLESIMMSLSLTDDFHSQIPLQDGSYGGGYFSDSPRGPIRAEYPTTSMPYPSLDSIKTSASEQRRQAEERKRTTGSHEMQAGNFNSFEQQRIQHSLSVKNQPKSSRVEGIPLSHYSPAKESTRSKSRSRSNSKAQKRGETPTPTGKTPKRKRSKSRSSSTTEHISSQNEPTPGKRRAHQTETKGVCTDPIESFTAVHEQPDATTNGTKSTDEMVQNLKQSLEEKEEALKTQLSSSEKQLGEQHEKIVYLEERLKSYEDRIENAKDAEKLLTEVKQKAENQQQIFDEQSRKKDEQIERLKKLIEESNSLKKSSRSSRKQDTTEKSSTSRDDVSKLDFNQLNTDGADPDLLLSPLSSATGADRSSSLSTGRRATERLQDLSESNSLDDNEWTASSPSPKLRRKKKKTARTSKKRHRVPTAVSKVDVATRKHKKQNGNTTAPDRSEEANVHSKRLGYEPTQVGLLLQEGDRSLSPLPGSSDGQLAPLRKYTDVPVNVETENGIITYNSNTSPHKNQSPANSPPRRRYTNGGGLRSNATGEPVLHGPTAKNERLFEAKHRSGGASKRLKKKKVTTSDGSRRYLLQNPQITPVGRRESLPPMRTTNTSSNFVKKKSDELTVGDDNHVRKNSKSPTPISKLNVQVGKRDVIYPKRHSLPPPGQQMEVLPPTSSTSFEYDPSSPSNELPKENQYKLKAALLERMKLYQEKNPKSFSPYHRESNKIAAPMNPGEIGFNGSMQYG